MNRNIGFASLPWHIAMSILMLLLLSSCSPKLANLQPELVQVGSMHESIGQQQHQGRARLDDIISTPHFYGVGALAELEGEIAILDSTPILTVVGPEGQPVPAGSSPKEATLLVGQSVSEWTSTPILTDVSMRDFDATIAQRAAAAGIDVSHPFVFVIDGEFLNVRAHVMNGACPIHARIRKLTIDSDKQPYELERGTLSGTVVGIYAANAVGRLTHPATSTHAHIIYADPANKNLLTGHIEQIGVRKGSTLRVPAMRRNEEHATR